MGAAASSPEGDQKPPSTSASASQQQQQQQRPPAALVVCGPSGVGKGTLIKHLMDKYEGKFGFSCSHTTRAPREGEQVRGLAVFEGAKREGKSERASEREGLGRAATI